MESAKKKQILWQVLAFAVPAAIVLLVFRLLGITPFGDRNLFYVDMAAQYSSFLCGYRELFTSGGLLYSFRKLLGGDMLSLAGYYMLSPFNLLLLVFPKTEINVLVSWLFLLKCAATGGAMYWYLHRRGSEGFVPLALSSAYALCSYMIVYGQNIMWLDAVILLPLLAEGLHRILAGKHAWLYLACLAAGLLVCYYTGWMLCLFSALYFVLFLLSECAPKCRLPALARFTAASLLAGGIGSVIWLPSYLSMSEEGKAHAAISFGLETTGSFRQMVQCMLHAPHTEDYSLPLLYCGVLSIVLAAAVLLFSSIGRGRKLSWILLLLTLLASIYFVAPNEIWHGLQEPSFFMQRFSFVYVFALLAFCGEGLPSLLEKFRLLQKPVLQALFALALCGELGVNAYSAYQAIGAPGGSRAEFLETTQSALALIPQDGSFSRLEKDYMISCDDGMALGYNGLSHYSSSYSRSALLLMRRLGYGTTSGYLRYNSSGTLAADSLLGVRYYLQQSPADPRLNAVGESSGITVSENPYALGLGIPCTETQAELGVGLPDSVNNFYSALLGRPVTIESATAATLTAENMTEPDAQGLAVPVDAAQKVILHYTFLVAEGGAYYGVFAYPADSTMTVSAAGRETERIWTSETGNTVYLGSYAAGDTAEVTVTLENAAQIAPNVLFFHEDTDVLAACAQELQNSSIHFDDTAGSRLSGTITLTQEQPHFVLTIPYARGWHVAVDGKAADTYAAFDSLLAFDAAPGEHSVTLYYWPRGLTVGLLWAGGSLLAAALWAWFARRSAKKLF
jgi:uncharacterized membrane protein YfhO